MEVGIYRGTSIDTSLRAIDPSSPVLFCNGMRMRFSNLFAAAIIGNAAD